MESEFKELMSHCVMMLHINFTLIPFSIKYSRIFYETLLQQRPNSAMAQDWCVAHGVLEGGDAVRAYLQVCKRKELDNHTGRWSPEEHELFIQGFELYGKKWSKIARHIPNRTSQQVSTHGINYFQKLDKGRQAATETNEGSEGEEESEDEHEGESEDEEESGQNTVFGYIRTSPRTENDGSLQERKIRIFYDQLKADGYFSKPGNDDSISEINVGLKIIHDFGTQRNSLVQSLKVGKLFQFLRDIPEGVPAFLLLAQLDRLGTNKEDIFWFLDAIDEINSNITILSMKEYGLDLYEVGDAISHYYGEKEVAHQEKFNETSTALNTMVDVESERLQQAIAITADRLKETWITELNGDLPQELHDLVVHAPVEDVDHSFRTHFLQACSKIDAGIPTTTVANELLDALNATIITATDDDVVIYTRTSPGTSLYTSSQGVPLDQAAMCNVHCVFPTCSYGERRECQNQFGYL